MGRTVNKNLVEQVKVFDLAGKPQGWIAEEVGVSRKTVQRYLSMPDDPEMASELSEQRKRFIRDAWEIIDGLNKIVLKRIKEGDFKGKDAAIAAAVYLDKIAIMERPGTRETTETIVINLVPSEGAASLPEPTPETPSQPIALPSPEDVGEDGGY